MNYRNSNYMGTAIQRFALFVCFSLWFTHTLAAKTYSTTAHSDQYKTLQVYPTGHWGASPVIAINSGSTVLISFDEMSHEYKRLAYRIIHCDQSWERSSLSEIEYMDGFPENEVEDYALSENTLTAYTHYSVTLPNEHIKFKVSGNYAVEIFDKEGDGTPVLTACFGLLDRKTTIKASCTANTDVDNEQSHQQLSLVVVPFGWTFQQPETEIKLTIQQNQRTDNLVQDITPLQIAPTELVYEHRDALIFDGGNEYRRFEITSYINAGLGVNKLVFFNPFYNAELVEDELRISGYSYDQDQDGRYLVHNKDVELDDTGSDYFLVHFSFPMKQPLSNGALKLQGDLVRDETTDSQLVYNKASKAYEKTLFLKQGAYNYQYVFQPTGSKHVTTAYTEGSYWQTENQYQIFVYYRAIGGRYDQLIGFSDFKTAF